jgi:hypothetical protein
VYSRAITKEPTQFLYADLRHEMGSLRPESQYKYF